MEGCLADPGYLPARLTRIASGRLALNGREEVTSGENAITWIKAWN